MCPCTHSPTLTQPVCGAAQVRGRSTLQPEATLARCVEVVCALASARAAAVSRGATAGDKLLLALDTLACQVVALAHCVSLTRPGGTQGCGGGGASSAIGDSVAVLSALASLACEDGDGSGTAGAGAGAGGAGGGTADGRGGGTSEAAARDEMAALRRHVDRLANALAASSGTLTTASRLPACSLPLCAAVLAGEWVLMHARVALHFRVVP